MPNLFETFVVKGPDLGATPIEVTPTIYQQLDEKFEGFKGCALVAAHSFDRDWSTWEIHPAGDEIVVLMSGAATFVLEEKGGHRTVQLAKPGEFVIVPKNTWHTARVSQPTTMIFVTPGEGTENREIGPRPSPG
jgi:mannose-6-phosphate isomerase-like protein (cupin superfamily)